MKYKNLGRSGLSVSRLCLGTMNFGPETDEATSHSIMDSALANGINFIDTANRYGGTGNWGGTEEILGRWFAKGEKRREKVVLATKLYGEMDTWPNFFPRGRAINVVHLIEVDVISLQPFQTCITGTPNM